MQYIEFLQNIEIGDITTTWVGITDISDQIYLQLGNSAVMSSVPIVENQDAETTVRNYFLGNENG
jgi:hypothetical protein